MPLAVWGVLLPILGVASALASEDAARRDGVTCSLGDYTTMVRQTYKQEVKENFDRERKELWADVEARERELRAQRDAISSSRHVRTQRDRVLPGNWQLVAHSAVGSYLLSSGPEERNMAVFDFAMEFRIFEDEWTSIPLVDAQTIVSDWRVLRATRDAAQWEVAQLGLETFLVLQRRQGGGDDEGAAAFDDHMLVTNQSGWYRLQFKAFLRVRNNRNLHSLRLNVLYPLSSTWLRIRHDTIAAHIRELSVEPAGFIYVNETEFQSDLHIHIPASKSMEVKWRVQGGTASKAPASKAPFAEGDAAEVEEASPPEVEAAQATVTHDSLHAIADGVLDSTHTFKYHLDSEQSLSSVEIVVLGAARVASVVAYGMQTWRTSSIVSNASLPGIAADAAGNLSGTTVHVSFKSSAISKEVILMVATELVFDVEAGTVELPLLVCPGVLRQSGTLAVVKVANVEVYERRALGATRTGGETVPSHIRGRTNRPIVLAYKFLSPRYAVNISVLGHEELSTLEAVGDSALYQALVVETQIMHSFLLVLQNTQRQYMEVRGIPPAATLYNLKVNSLATKPVRGRGGTLLTPLLVGSSGGSNDGVAAQTSVSLAWLTTHKALGGNGTLNLDPPQVDMPVSALNIEVQMPHGYEANFSGSMTRVASFSQRQPNPVSYETSDDVVPKDFDFSSMPPPGSNSARAGVTTKVPKFGRRFLFEKLLVVNGSATLSASYAFRHNVTNATQEQEQLWQPMGFLFLLIIIPAYTIWINRGNRA